VRERPAARSGIGRLVDLTAAIGDAMRPLPFRVGMLAVDGFVTLLVGRRGEHKSWLAQFACASVHSGEPVGPLFTKAGRALYVDGEGGERLMGRRLLSTGMDADAFHYADGSGLRLPDDIGEVRELVDTTSANLLILDSLRRLAPTMKENESDSAAPVMASLTELSRETEVAVVAICHRSTKPGAPNVRGSSALEAQADIVWQCERVAGDPDGRHRRRLRCTKMRVDEEPAAMWVRFRRVAGFMTVGEAEPYESPADPDRDDGPASHEQTADSIRALAAQVASESGWAPTQLAEAVGSSQRSGTFQRAIDLLIHRGEWEAVGSTRSRRYRPVADSRHSRHPLSSGANGANGGPPFDDDEGTP
jgi:hypothetical protein